MSNNWTFLAKSVVSALVLALSIMGYAPAAMAESIVGIGAVIEKKSNGRFQIIETVENGPAARAGVMAGEYIAAVDARASRGMDLDELVALVRGTEGSFVTLNLTNERETSNRDVRMMRARMELQCFLEGSINLRVSVFNGSGYVQGNVGNQFVNLNIFGGRASGSIGNQNVWLDIYVDDVYNRVSIQGWVRNTYVRWDGSSGFRC